MRLLLIEILIAVLVITVNGQWVIQNHTVVNTTYYGHPGYPAPIPQGPPPGFVKNNIGYHPPGYGFVRNATGYNNSFAVKQNGNDLLVGTPGPGDVILFKEYFAKPSRWLQIREKTISYPTYPTTAKSRITAVHAIDMSKTPGGHAKILTGGVGYSYVTIFLSSERSKGFSYKIIIYGHNF